MATTMTAFRDELRARLLTRSETSASNLRLDRVIKSAIYHITSPKIHRHEDLEIQKDITTVNGTDIYDINAELWTLFVVRDVSTNNRRRIVPMGFQRMQELWKTTGQPLRYARWSQQMHFDPIPSGIYTIRIWGYGYPQFTLGGDGLISGNFPLREVYKESALLLAEAKAWSQILKDVKRGKALRDEFMDEFGTIVAPVEGELDDQEDVLQPDLDGLQGTGR